MPGPMRVLFTGVSGVVGTDLESLKKLASFARRRYGRDVRVLRAEHYFCDEAFSCGALDTGGQTGSRPFQMIQALTLPKPVLAECHRRAFERLASEHDLLGAEEDTFLFAHTCFYHQKSREFFSLVDEELIRDSFDPNLVLTLIDDVEHIHARLRQSAQMFDDIAFNYKGRSGIVNSCQHLAGLMHWRGSEFASSERLARRLDCEHYLVAVKHPLESIAALIYQRTRPKVYLSHPITEVRKQLAGGDTDAYRDFCDGLRCCCEALRQKVILFEPTTIDEFRFRSVRRATDARGGADEVYLPQVTRRWPSLAPEETLWSPVTELANPVDPDGYLSEEVLRQYEDSLGSVQCPLPGYQLGEIEFVAALVGTLVRGTLAGSIADEIAARDYKLVEQCSDLVAIRPCYNGRFSDGVKHEIEHHCILHADPTHQRGTVWVFTTHEDDQLWRQREILGWAVGGFPGLDSKHGKTRLLGLDATLSELDLVREILSISRDLGASAVSVGGNPLAVGPAAAAGQELVRLAEDLAKGLVPPYRRVVDECAARLGLRVRLEVFFGETWPDADMFDAIASGRSAEPYGDADQCERT